jgi:hypothetical protein
MRLFLYGTLLDAGTLAFRGGQPALASRSMPATLPGWGGSWRCQAVAILPSAAVGQTACAVW